MLFIFQKVVKWCYVYPIEAKKEGGKLRVKVEVNQFAKIDEAAVYLDEFLLFVGDNNSGKTLLMELIYGIVKLICEWDADSSKAKMTERLGMKQYGFAQEWFKDTEDRINLYLHDYKEKFIMETFKCMISLGNVAIKFEDFEGFFLYWDDSK